MDLPTPHTDIDGFLEYLRSEVGDALRSCVEYTPESSAVHYLRADIPDNRAGTRLVRVEELYHAERLAVTPPTGDTGLGHLRASVHRFDGALVVHLLDEAGRAVGVSLDPDTPVDLTSFLDGCLGALYRQTTG